MKTQKNIKIILTTLIVSAGLVACTSGEKVIATNDEKADYLEQQKEQFDQPKKLDNTYDRGSGKGGGVRDR